jgi:ABC-type Fe3+ transport system permease subunit
MKRFKQILLSVFIAGSVGLVTVPVLASATAKSDACAALGSDASCTTNPHGGLDLTTVIRAVINILSIVVGVVAVIMIIVAGLRYITSGGDSNGITSARNTLLYAIVGLVIVAMSQVLVQFVIHRTNSSTCASNQVVNAVNQCVAAPKR